MESAAGGESPAVPEGAPESRSGNPLQSIWGVLLAPEKTFRELALRPRWLPALALILISSFAFFLVLSPKMDMKQMIRDAVEKQGGEISETRLDAQAGLVTKIGFASQLVLQPAFYLLMATIFLVVLRLLGSEIDFRRSLSVTVHGMLPFLVAALLTFPIVLARSQVSVDDMRYSRLLRSNLAVFAPESAGHVLLALLSSLDIFTCWTLFLLAVGYRVVGRVSSLAAWGTVLALWLLAVAGKMGMAAFS